MKDTLLVPTRYRGPARSGNGGYVAGALAHELGDTLGRAVTVTLRQPPPLDASMHVDRVDDGVTLTFGGAASATIAAAPDVAAPSKPIDLGLGPESWQRWMTAPTGTSPRAAAARASSKATLMGSLP